MADIRESAAEALLVCVERGRPFPRRPQPADLWEGCGGKGEIALLVMLDFIAIERHAKNVEAARSRQDWLERRDLGELVA